LLKRVIFLREGKKKPQLLHILEVVQGFRKVWLIKIEKDISLRLPPGPQVFQLIFDKRGDLRFVEEAER